MNYTLVNYAVIVIQDNQVKTLKIFGDYFMAEAYCNSLILSLDPEIENFPKYRSGEIYEKPNMTIGVYY